jgi:ABC-type transport system involved in cytochrome c biogenesis permease subunit
MELEPMTIPSLFSIAALVALVASAALGFAGVAIRLARPAVGAAADRSAAVLSVGPMAVDLIGPYRLIQAAGLLLLGALISLAIQAGRAPWANLGETAVAFATGLVAAYLFIVRPASAEATSALSASAGASRGLGLAPLVAALAAVLAAYGLALPSEITPLVPALQQPVLLTVHVGTAVLSYGVGGVAFLAALGEIAQRRTGDGIPLLPPANAARLIAQRAVIVAFPLLTAAIVLGAIWANLAWRSYWNNDPKELAAAATWLVYAAELHVAGRRDRWGAAAPWLLVIGFAGILFTWLGAGLVFIGQHGYATG